MLHHPGSLFASGSSVWSLIYVYRAWGTYLELWKMSFCDMLLWPLDIGWKFEYFYGGAERVIGLKLILIIAASLPAFMVLLLCCPSIRKRWFGKSACNTDSTCSCFQITTVNLNLADLILWLDRKRSLGFKEKVWWQSWTFLWKVSVSKCKLSAWHM